MGRSKNDDMRFGKGGNIGLGLKVFHTSKNNKRKPLRLSIPTVEKLEESIAKDFSTLYRDKGSDVPFNDHFLDKHLKPIPKQLSKAQKKSTVETYAQKDKRKNNDFFMAPPGQIKKAGKYINKLPTKGEMTIPIRAYHVKTNKGIVDSTNPDSGKKHSYNIVTTDTRERHKRKSPQVGHFKGMHRSTIPHHKSTSDSSDSD